MKSFCDLQKIDEFNSLRFVFAILIFCGHYFTNLRLSQFGASSVAFFFILSGFSVSFGYSGKVISNELDYKKYMIKRIKKLYPLNLFCLLLFLILPLYNSIQTGDFNPLSYGLLVLNVSLIQSWIPIQGVYFSGNAVAWFLCDILFCYLLFPVLLKVLNKNIRYMICILVAYFIIVQFIPSEYIHALIYIYPLFRIVDFCLGISLYLIIKNNPRLIIKGYYLVLLELVSLVIFLFSLFVFKQTDAKYALTSLFWIPSLLIIYSVVLRSLSGGGISCILKSKFWTYLGVLSFPFYMFHDIVIHWHLKICSIIDDHSCFDKLADYYYDYSVLGAILCISTTLLLSYLYVHYVSPFIGRKLISRL